MWTKQLRMSSCILAYVQLSYKKVRAFFHGPVWVIMGDRITNGGCQSGPMRDTGIKQSSKLLWKREGLILKVTDILIKSDLD